MSYFSLLVALHLTSIVWENYIIYVDYFADQLPDSHNISAYLNCIDSLRETTYRSQVTSRHSFYYKELLARIQNLN